MRKRPDDFSTWVFHPSGNRFRSFFAALSIDVAYLGQLPTTGNTIDSGNSDVKIVASIRLLPGLGNAPILATDCVRQRPGYYTFAIMSCSLW